MDDRDAHRSSWSIRHDGGGSDHADRVFEELASLCRDTCVTHFPEGSGYVTVQHRLSGPVEGVSLTVQRGDFRGVLSVQRFVKPGDRPQDCREEIRVVCSARHDGCRDLVRVDPSSTRWSIAGCAIGTMGVGAAGLELTGLLTAWGQILLLIPALMAWRMCMAIRMISTYRQQAALDAQRDQIEARRSALATAQARDWERWTAALAYVAEQRDAVTERVHLRPFRTQGSSPGSAGGSTEPRPLPPVRPVTMFG